MSGVEATHVDTYALVPVLLGGHEGVGMTLLAERCRTRSSQRMSPLEIVAALCGAIAVWLTTRQHILSWPIGLIQVALYVFIFLEARLYSDMVLHVIYVGLQLYGWYNWLHGGAGGTVLHVSRLTPGQGRITLAVVITSTGLWGYFMGRYTDAELVYPDAFIAVASLASQWLLTKKKVESWWGWIVVDVIAIAVYWAKDLTVTAILYALFLVLAVIGERTWRRSLDPECTRA